MCFASEANFYHGLKNCSSELLSGRPELGPEQSFGSYVELNIKATNPMEKLLGEKILGKKLS